MFDNIGKKIKKIAQIECWAGIASYILLGLILLFENEIKIYVGILIMGVGSFLSWIGSLMIYGFGQLIENSNELVVKQKIIYSEIQMLNLKKEDVASTISSSSITPIPQSSTVNKIVAVSAPQKTKESIKASIKETVPETSSDLLCPNCNENLSIMGYTESDLGSGEKCPLCGEDI